MEVKVPEIGESIVEALVANWIVEDGAEVAQDEIICELETDKVNVELPADASGILHIKVKAGETVDIGTVIATIDEDAGGTKESETKESETKESRDKGSKDQESEDKESRDQESEDKESRDQKSGESAPAINPAAKKLAREKQIDLAEVEGSGRAGRITVEDVQKAVETSKKSAPQAGEKGQEAETSTAKPADKADKADKSASEQPAEESERPVTREAMTPIRQRIAERLLQARQQTAMLTTFNEADMSWVKKLRSRHQKHFTEKHGIKLGLMSFFVKSCIKALQEYPAVNARIDGTDIVYHHYYDIGIAVGTDRGLVVPILRDADQLTFAEIEQQIAELASRAQSRKLTLAELEGGTFTISNGGIYGSLLSTPLINPPQCGVLGMHAIQDRAVVHDGEIVVRPIMNLALSYDHRLIDGREAVGFLKLIKEYIEDPSELFLEL
ncbi:MAG: 2-oxoglutarate dehydrogenase complex dihydrolipoyllysine-residue succinyltransferase [Desulfuromonadales bacterium]